MYLTEGIRKIVYTDADGVERNPTVRLIGPNVGDNDWLVANQVTVTEGDHKRRFDAVLYLNGMPVGFLELKKAGIELKGAHAQVTTYVDELPLAFRFNADSGRRCEIARRAAG